MSRFVLIFFGCMLLHGLCHGQVDTSLTLPRVDVRATRMIQQPVGSYSTTFDSAQLTHSHTTDLTDLLERQTGWFVKHYGGSSLATSSVRGGSASHTTVHWNGLPLENPMLGQMDFSLLPLHFADRITIQQGGHSGIWGSGAIGGSISLQNNIPRAAGLSVLLESSTGSFGHWQHQFEIQYKGKQFATVSKGFHQQAINDFKYRLRDDLPVRTQEHAASRQSGILQSLYWTLPHDQLLKAHFWWQQADREIPPKTTQNFSEAVQEDELMRTQLHYQNKFENAILNIRTAWTDETNDYRDPLAGIDAHNRFKRLILDAEYQHSMGIHHLGRIGWQSTWTQGISDGYSANKERIRMSAYGAWRFQHDPWNLQVESRAEWMDGTFQAIVPAAGVQYKLTKDLGLRARIGRKYRLPTLNDLYWHPGGNEHLQPEVGWSQEIGFDLEIADMVKYSATAFNRNIEQWILWAPTEGPFYWSAQNLTEVHSRGIEQRVECTWPIGEHIIDFQSGYDYIKSTNKVTLKRPRIEQGDQLIYVPEHRFFTTLTWRWKGIRLDYNHRYTGSVMSENETLPSYSVGSMSIAYHLNMKRWSGSVFSRVDNIWDTSYMIVERRPMPGRHYQFGIQVHFHSPKNNLQCKNSTY